jgi:nucleotide-binding universal stress UspA family protein
VFRNAVVGIDGQERASDAVALARQLTAADGLVTLAHVYGIGLHGGEPAEHQVFRRREGSLELLERERDECLPEAQIVAWVDRSVGRGLHRLAQRQAAELLVIGSSRRGPLARVLLGSDMLSAINGAPCAVAIAPPRYAAGAHPIGCIGVGSDASPESEQALAAARELARRHGSTIKALSVVSLQSLPQGEPIPNDWPEVAEQLMGEELRRLRGQQGAEGQVSSGEPSEELARFSEHLDLLIVGSRSYGPVGRLVNGSVSNYLAARAHCPLLVLPRSASERAEAAAEQATLHG